jgi:hypothetical protein
VSEIFLSDVLLCICLNLNHFAADVYILKHHMDVLDTTHRRHFPSHVIFILFIYFVSEIFLSAVLLHNVSIQIVRMLENP